MVFDESVLWYGPTLLTPAMLEIIGFDAYFDNEEEERIVTIMDRDPPMTSPLFQLTGPHVSSRSSLHEGQSIEVRPRAQTRVESQINHPNKLPIMRTLSVVMWCL